MTGLAVQEIESGLWRWSAPHPEWDPHPEPTTGWIEEVGSVYCELPGAILLIDPVVPADEDAAARLWSALDRDVERLRRPVCVVVTVHWHRRGADAMVARYGAHDGVVRTARARSPWVTPSERPPMPCPVSARSWSATSWSAATRSRASARPGVRMCPPGWYGSTAAERAWYGGPRSAERVAAPRAGAAERVLTTHGTPLLSGGSAALRTLAERADGRRAA